MSIWTDLNDQQYALSYVQVGRWRTRILEAGNRDGDGPTVVLMHGTGGHLEAYARNIAVLARTHRVVAFDFPGQGYTSRTTADLEITDYVEHLRELLDVLRIDETDLCGESLGGWVAIKFTAAHPGRVRRLVLNTPGGTMANPDVMDRIRCLSQEAADDPTPARIRARLEWLMADPATVTEELVDVRRRIYAQPGFAESMQHVLCLQDPDIRRRNLVSAEDLAAVPGPALIIWTSDDPSGPAGAGLAMAAGMSDGQFHLIQDAGHWPQWEQPQAYNDITTAFLNEVGISG